MSLDFVVRPFAATDRAFVADAWLNSLRAATDESRYADWAAFKAQKNAAIDKVLDDASTRLWIAAPKGDELTIYGYLVGADTRPEMHPPAARVLHMLFVKKPFRRLGVATRLLAAAGVELGAAVCTQWTRDLGDWILKKSQTPDGRDRFGKQHLTGGLQYNPFWAAAP